MFPLAFSLVSAKQSGSVQCDVCKNGHSVSPGFKTQQMTDGLFGARFRMQDFQNFSLRVGIRNMTVKS